MGDEESGSGSENGALDMIWRNILLRPKVEPGHGFGANCPLTFAVLCCVRADSIFHTSRRKKRESVYSTVKAISACATRTRTSLDLRN